MGLEFEGAVYRWAEAPLRGRKDITILETSLRDGDQASGIKHPRREMRAKLLELMDKIGIEYADIAMPIARGPYLSDAIWLAQHKINKGLSIKLVCLARALDGDVERAVELKKQSGLGELEVIVFKGSSPLRRQVEDWDADKDLVKPLSESIKKAVESGLNVTAATEDTTRTEPEVLENIFNEAIKAGASRICIADTVGFSDQWQVKETVDWFKANIIRNSGIRLDWHGHNDLGLGTANSYAALAAGVDRVHTTVSSVGERAGNASSEEIIEILAQNGIKKYSREYIMEYAKMGAHIFDRRIASDRPITGDGVHSTSTGIHGAGIAKALEMNRKDLAGIVYSSVDPADYGREPILGVGPLSGEWNVNVNLRRLGIKPTEQRSGQVLKLAQMLFKELNDEEIISAALADEQEVTDWEQNGFNSKK